MLLLRRELHHAVPGIGVNRREDAVLDSEVGMAHVRALDGMGQRQCDATEIVVRHRFLSAAASSVPIWSTDGRSLLYVGHDGISLLPRPNAQPVEIARPLYRGPWPAYYGQMPWPDQFAWWSS